MTDKGHWGHYSLKGPYGDTCNTVDKIDDAPGVSFAGTEMPNMRRSIKKKEKQIIEEEKLGEINDDYIPQI